MTYSCPNTQTHMYIRTDKTAMHNPPLEGVGREGEMSYGCKRQEQLMSII